MKPKIEFRVVTVVSPLSGPKLLLATFTEEDWGNEGAKSAAVGFAKAQKERNPNVSLTVEEVVTTENIVRTIPV